MGALAEDEGYSQNLLLNLGTGVLLFAVLNLVVEWPGTGGERILSMKP